MKGILFKNDMIKAIVDKRKTVTRRLAGLKEINQGPDNWDYIKQPVHWSFYRTDITDGEGHYTKIVNVKPRYQVGETVYIKEAWRIITDKGTPNDFGVVFKDGGIGFYRDNAGTENYPIDDNWHSPLFLPEKYARYFIKITDVRAERLQEITHQDANKEGCKVTMDSFQLGCSYIAEDYRENFIRIWNSLNKDYQWESNPWVWRYEFGQINIVEL